MRDSWNDDQVKRPRPRPRSRQGTRTGRVAGVKVGEIDMASGEVTELDFIEASGDGKSSIGVWPFDWVADKIVETTGYMAPTQAEIDVAESSVQQLEENIEEREAEGTPPPATTYTAVEFGQQNVSAMQEQRDRIMEFPDVGDLLAKAQKYAKYGAVGLGLLVGYKLLKDFRII